jgi:hypothetical protein
MKTINLKSISQKGTSLIKLVTASVLAMNMVGCTVEADYTDVADRNDVATFGDSIFDLNGVIQTELEANAGETFRDYTTSGAKLSGGSLAPAVDEQYASANAANPDITTVVMNGGGNDILIPAMIFDQYRCKTKWYRPNLSSSCKNLINNIKVTQVDLLDQMANDGVEDIIYLAYYELVRGNDNLNQAVHYGDQKLIEGCDGTIANCTLVDPRGTISAAQIESDDIHPTVAGSEVLAAQVWPLLEPLL